jgi:hypothetical protein
VEVGSSDILQRIERKLDEDIASRRREKMLDSVTGPVFGLGLFAMGVAIPTFTQAVGDYLRDPQALEWLAQTAISGVLVWIGARLTLAAVAVQAYFAETPDQLASFLAMFEDGKHPGQEISRWIKQPTVRDSGAAKSLARVVLAFQVGFWVMLGLGVVFLGSSLTIALLAVRAVWGWTISVALMATAFAVVVLGYQVMRLVASLRASRLKLQWHDSKA